MHSSRVLQSAISILALLGGCQLSDATPLGSKETEENGLEKRCDNPCGYYSQLCCASNEVCSTNNSNQAVCLSSGSDSGSASGTWEYYTTTYIVTETDLQTITSVWSSMIASPTSSTCRADIGETTCGDDCCDASFVCKNKKCVFAGTSVWATETGTANPPSRPTSSETVTETATTTQGFEVPVTTDGSPAYGVDAPDDSGLSGGAIAGIVIGTIAGVFLLFLVCACLCFRGILASILACLGLGKRKRREENYVEEHHSHHTHRPPGRTWFGTRPSGSEHGEKKSWWSSLATIGIIIGAIALCLGLRRHKDHDEKSDYTYPSYYSYYTSTTSESSDRRTRRSRRSGRSRSRTHS